MKTLVNLRNKLDKRRTGALRRYREFVGRLAEGKGLRPADEAQLAELLGVLGITPSDVEADVSAFKQHAELTRLGKADDADRLGQQAAEARRQAEEHRTAARKAEQAALSLDARLRALAHRRHELAEVERLHPRLFASDIEVALGQPPEAEDTERPTDRPEPPVHELVVRQAAERLGWPPVAAGGRP